MKKYQVKLRFAGEIPANDANQSEVDIPRIEVYVPVGIIRNYNLVKHHRNSSELPDAADLCDLLLPDMKGKGYRAPNTAFPEQVDRILEELMEHPFIASYKEKKRAGVVIVVEGEYTPADDV